MAIVTDKKNAGGNDHGDVKENTQNLSSENIPNAHAAGDGAAGRSKEAITEEDVHPQEDVKKTQEGNAPY